MIWRKPLTRTAEGGREAGCTNSETRVRKNNNKDTHTQKRVRAAEKRMGGGNSLALGCTHMQTGTKDVKQHLVGSY